jgi:outer membrane receptor protein involved in Fe transport
VAELQSAAEGLDRRCSELEDVVGSAAAAKARNEMVHTMNRTVLSLETKADSTSQVLHQKVSAQQPVRRAGQVPPSSPSVYLTDDDGARR